MKRKTVEFENIGGSNVPTQPWPQVFYINAWLLETDGYEVRPLTLTGLVKGIGKNLVTMNFWRLMRLLRILGFLSTPTRNRFSRHDLTWRCWHFQMWWRLWPVCYFHPRHRKYLFR